MPVLVGTLWTYAVEFVDRTGKPPWVQRVECWSRTRFEEIHYSWQTRKTRVKSERECRLGPRSS